MKRPKPSLVIPFYLQVSLLTLTGIVFVIRVVLGLNYLLMVYPGWNGFRPSEWSVYTIADTLFPVIFFGLAYWLGSRHKNSIIRRGFMAVILTVAAIIASEMLFMILTAMQSHVPLVANLSPWILIAPPVLTAILFTALLLRIRPDQKTETPQPKHLFILLVSSYCIFILQEIVTMISQFNLTNYNVFSDNIALTILVQIVLIAITYLAVDTKLPPQIRAIKTCIYLLLPGLTFFAVGNLLMLFVIITRDPSGILTPLSITTFTLIPVLYLSFLWIARRRAAL